MAFSFGSAATFGGTPNKPTGFGAPLSFGSTPATTAQTGFGFGSNFGTPTAQPQQQQQPGFGSTSFGQPAAGAMAPAFGSSFGQTAGAAAPAFGSTFGTPATSAPAFGSSFGAAPAATAPAFGAAAFGSAPTSTPAFGSAFGTQATPAPAFGSTFGTPAASTPSLFGAAAPKPVTTPGLFGSNPTAQAPSLFGATATSAAPGLFGAPTSSAPPLFGSTFGTATTSTTGLFGSSGGFGLGSTPSTNTGFNLFGSATTTTAPSFFSGGFGKTTTPAAGGLSMFSSQPAGFGGFGTTPTAPNLFGANALQPNKALMPGTNMVALPQTPIQQMFASIYAISLFGDERDVILKKWNMLQASWGVGKGYYNTSQPPIEYNSENPFFRYRAIGYAVIPGEDNSHGFVKLNFNKKESELGNQKEVLSNGILGILGNKPNLTVHIEHVKGIGDNQCEVMISVSEKGVTGSCRKIPALDLSAFLNQAMQKQQLASVGVTFIGAYVSPTRSQLQEYLKNPPAGIELQFWQSAQSHNPNPKKFMPMAINGFTDLKKRMLCEQHETNLHREYLNKVNKELMELNKKHSNSVAKIMELKQKFAELQHRLLKIVIKQEVTRKLGMALQPEEEILKGRLEQILAQIMLPSQFKSQLFEIRCKMQTSGTSVLPPKERYDMDKKIQEDIKQFLKMEQNGIAHLMNLINTDLKNLKIISDGMAKMRR